MKVVSMGCGTKSIGKKFMRGDGLAVNDSHAEVLARRGLLKHLQTNWDAYFRKVSFKSEKS